MKLTFTIALIILGLFAKAQNVTSNILIQKIRAKAQNYLNSNSHYPKNRAATNWSEVSAEHPRINKKILERTTYPEINVKIDSLLAIDKSYPGYPNTTTIYKVIHIVQAKGSTVFKCYSFQFDNNLNILQVDEGSPQELIEQNQKLMKQVDLAKRLITEISDMKLAILKAN
ncbi:hypothetical protein GWR56_00760 [Mucilaginibacter sp. 14171R-50]|uniref:hypothetical protein n=1 Tax=Mucilaginibacter sp. 14171R-50 TaxID=2703789 RepID=UPI00138BD17C|nr:hypothetical protein [Mucilaginibacter sp. 14171R-50]QHS54149.1 hypothetical protein GWR56_00760 [Mucilaginibacter sp. 14171R-50]